MISSRHTALAMVLALAGTAAIASGCGDNTDTKTGAGVSAIVFIKRAHTRADANGAVSINVSGGNGQVLDYQRFVPGGSLVILSPARPDGDLKNVTADFPTADFNGADVSFDAKQIVFSMKKDEQDHYHIYTAQVTPGAGGKFEVHQLTAGDYDDINPIYIAGGRIAFVTNQGYTQMGTRADEYEHAREVTQLATISVEGGDADRKLASQNLSHTVAPWLRHDGKIGYCRWEHLGPVNDVKLFAANPDGTQMLALSGQHGKPSNALFTPREIEPNVMIGIATTRNRTIHAGAIIKIDARNQNDPVCLDAAADHTGHACIDEENAKFEILTPDVPVSNGPSPVGRYREPSMLPDGRILVSWADGPVNDLSEQSATPPDFGVYIYNPKTNKNELIYNDRNTWELNALPLVARKEPPVIGNFQGNGDPTQAVRVGSLDVTRTSLKDGVDGAQFKGTPLDLALKDAVRVRVIEGFSSEGAKGVTMFGLTMHEGAAMLGEAPVYKDGSWMAEIPPFIPVHLQPIDKWGMAIRNQMLWIQGMPGEDRRCVGCHESRTGAGVPRFGQNPTVAEQRPPEKFTMAIADRIEYGWDKIQPMLTAKCASCHNAQTTQYYSMSRTDPATGGSTVYKIPTLDLTDTPVTVVYDRQVATYPSSYVSIFFPAAADMTGPGVQITGTLPPRWGVPGSARQSKLIEKINLKAEDGAMAWTTPMHPEDKGPEHVLTQEERAMLVRLMDMGGQYYSRQNTGFVPYGNDPVAGIKY